MRSRVKPGGFQCRSDLAEDLFGPRGQWQPALVKKPFDVEAAKPDALEMKSRHGFGQRLQLVEEFGFRVARRLLVDEGDEFLDPILGSLAMIHCRILAVRR